MRLATFVLAIAALVFACVGFWVKTLPAIEKAHVDRAELASLVERGLERARREGAPPSHTEVAAAASEARILIQDSSALRAAWYADAAKTSDYLAPRAMRAAPAATRVERERIEQALLALPADLKATPGLSPARLGLHAPSLSESFPDDPDLLADQAERAVAVRLLVTALRAQPKVRVDDAALQRVSGSGLQLKVDALAGLSDAIALFENLLASSDDAPPRRLRRFELARIPPREWAGSAKDLGAPPVRISLAILFDFPAVATGSAR